MKLAQNKKINQKHEQTSPLTFFVKLFLFNNNLFDACCHIFFFIESVKKHLIFGFLTLYSLLFLFSVFCCFEISLRAL